MKLISLFSGCGGLDLGFEKAGFEIPVHPSPDDTLEKDCEKPLPNQKKYVTFAQHGGVYFEGVGLAADLIDHIRT